MADQANRLLTFASVLERTGLSRTTIWRMLQDPDSAFPQPCEIRNRKMFSESEISAWIDDQLATRQQAA